METVTLRNGIVMPMEGFGVYQVEPAEAERVVSEAIAAGYRSIDTAASYFNEEAVGRAVRACGLPREDLFITSKVWVQDFGYEKTKRAVETSLEKLGMDHMDLCLLHQSLSDYYGAWRALEELYRVGTLRAIGVANFYPERLTDLCCNADIPPMVNQIECHPFFQRGRDLEAAKVFGVAVEAWAPLAEAGRGVFAHPVIAAIAEKHGRTSAQVILRWNVQRGVIVIPKTVHAERMKENLAIWDFALDEDDMARMAQLDTGHTEIIDHYDWKIAKFLNEYKIHD